MTITTQRVYTMEIGPEEAGEWLSKSFDAQRSMRPSVVRNYVSEMQRGQWIAGGTIGVAVLNGTQPPLKTLIDGYHRMAAIRNSGTRQQFVIVEMHCDNPAEIMTLYNSQDIGLPRKPADALHAAQYGESIGIGIRWERNVAAGLQFIADEFGNQRRKLSRQDLIEMAIPYKDAVMRYYLALSDGLPEITDKMKRSGVMAVALVTCKDAVDSLGEDVVLSFWQGIAQNNGLANNDPRSLFVRYLLQTAYGGGGGSGKNNQSTSKQYESRYLAGCWNAYADRRTLAKAVVRDVFLPIRIKGTRFVG